MSNFRYVTTLPRAAMSLLAGALVAGPATILIMLAPAIGSSVYDLKTFVAQFAFASIAAVIVYALGLLVLAAPIWALLHNRGHRSWRSAITLGGALGFTVTLLLYLWPTFPIRPEGSSASFGGSAGMLVEDNVVTSLGWTTFLGYSSVYALVCALVGFLIWRLAYRTDPSFSDT